MNICWYAIKKTFNLNKRNVVEKLVSIYFSSLLISLVLLLITSATGKSPNGIFLINSIYFGINFIILIIILLFLFIRDIVYNIKEWAKLKMISYKIYKAECPIHSVDNKEK